MPLFAMEVWDLKNMLLCITVRLLKSIWRCVCLYKLVKSDVIIFYMTLIVAMVCSYSSGSIEWEKKPNFQCGLFLSLCQYFNVLLTCNVKCVHLNKV